MCLLVCRDASAAGWETCLLAWWDASLANRENTFPGSVDWEKRVPWVDGMPRRVGRVNAPVGLPGRAAGGRGRRNAQMKEEGLFE